MQSVILEEVPHHNVYEGVSQLWLSTTPRHPVRIASTLQGRRKSGEFAPDSTWFTYRHGAADVVVESPHEVNHCYVEGHVVEEVAASLFRGDPGHVELVPAFGIEDPAITRLLANVRDAMRAPEAQAGRLYSDYLARALAAHVLSRYAAFPDALLSQARISRFGKTVGAAVIEHMRENMERDVSIQELALVSHCSPTHFARRFRSTFDCTPHRYLTRMRIDHAKRLLVQTDLPIGQIGALCGFPDHAYFSSLFRRTVGMTPMAYRAAHSR
jgi:AraC family transcriptional regulator